MSQFKQYLRESILKEQWMPRRKQDTYALGGVHGISRLLYRPSGIEYEPDDFGVARQSDNTDYGGINSRPNDISSISGQGGYSRPVDTSGTLPNWPNDDDILIPSLGKWNQGIQNTDYVEPIDKPVDTIDVQTSHEIETKPEPTEIWDLSDPYIFRGITNDYGLLRKKTINFNEIN
tara:strand:- start:106 stop:633 length:528 start_codon:yes stop_codon:yes gene_type:complete